MQVGPLIFLLPSGAQQMKPAVTLLLVALAAAIVIAVPNLLAPVVVEAVRGMW
jgi:hypothetical protein